MPFSEHDRLRDVERSVSEIFRSLHLTPVRDTSPAAHPFYKATADEFIGVGNTGNVTVSTGVSFAARNATGHPIWTGSTVWVSPYRKLIVNSNAANIVIGDYQGGGATDTANYAWLSVGNKFVFASSDLTNVGISDTAGVLTGIATDDVIVFASGGDKDADVLYPIVGPGVAGGGGGGGEWPGWPGPDPEPGTATVSIGTAFVDGATTAATLSFDNGATIVGTVDVSGTADNEFGKPFEDNEEILLISQNDGDWSAVKIGVNILTGQVNQAGHVDPADTTFPFDGGSAIAGVGPTTGTAVNDPAEYWADNEEVVLIQRDDGDWQPIRATQPPIRVKGQAVGAVDRTDTTFTIDQVVAVTGSSPIATGAGTLTIKNDPPIKCENNDIVFAIFDDSAGADLTDSWSTADVGNRKLLFQGDVDYDEAEYQVYFHGATADDIKWLDATICNPPS